MCGLKSRYATIGIPAIALRASGMIVADGGFEAGTPNPSWTEASTNFGTPLCDETSCGLGGGTGPRTGSWWAWFGGIAAAETGSVEQTVSIPTGSSASLDFWLEIPVSSGNGTDFMNVLMDGNMIFTVLEGNATYALVSLDVTTFGDGGSHLLRFESTITGAPAGSNFFVDDVSINVTSVSEVTTIQITIDSMPLDPARVGEVWWAGPSVPINNSPNPSLTGAQVLCEATPSNAEAWPVGSLHLFGGPIVPGASYEVRMCDPTGANCSDPLLVATGKWGDVKDIFGGGGQPDFVDISAIVDKFGNLASAPDTSQTDLRGGGNPGNPNVADRVIDFTDISIDVDAFSGDAYPFMVPACP